MCSVLALWTLGPGRMFRDTLYQDFGLSREGLAAGRWWTYVTYAFLHGSIWHASCNLAGLWVVSNHVLEHHGRRAYFALLLLGIVAGGLAQLATSSDGVLIGMSGGVIALVTAAGFLWHHHMVALRIGPWRLLFLQGKHLGWGVLLGTCLLAAVSPWLPAYSASIGHMCHAGAACAAAMAVLGARLAAR